MQLVGEERGGIGGQFPILREDALKQLSRML